MGYKIIFRVLLHYIPHLTHYICSRILIKTTFPKKVFNIYLTKNIFNPSLPTLWPFHSISINQISKISVFKVFFFTFYITVLTKKKIYFFQNFPGDLITFFKNRFWLYLLQSNFYFFQKLSYLLYVCEMLMPYHRYWCFNNRVINDGLKIHAK